MYLLLGIVATCISATAGLLALDASRPVAMRTPLSQPSGNQPDVGLPSGIVVIPGSSAEVPGGSFPSVIISSGQGTAQGTRVSFALKGIGVSVSGGGSS
jgi:hypothetical protein